MQASAKMSVCVDTLNTTTTCEPLTVFIMNNLADTLNTTTTCEPLTVFIMNNLAFCQLALNSEPAGSLF